MAPPPKFGGSFAPSELEQMALAYEIALKAAVEGGSPFAAVPAHDLRHRLASFIIAGARKGPIQAERLSRFALEGLRVLTPQSALDVFQGH